MFDRLRLWTKIMLMMGLAIGGVGAVLTFTNLTNLTRVVQHAERSALSAHYQAIANAVAAESRTPRRWLRWWPACRWCRRNSTLVIARP